MRRIISASDLVLFVILSAVGCWFVWHRPAGLDVNSASILAGAMYGAAALLLGNWINRWNEARHEKIESTRRAGKLKVLTAARLVDVACAVMTTKRLADAAFISGVAVRASELLGPFPRPISFVRDLGADLPLIDDATIDALAMLESNLEITRQNLEERSRQAVPMLSPVIGLTGVVKLLSHDLEILAQCFEHVAPARRLDLEGKGPEIASVLLRRKAKMPADRVEG